MNKVEKHLDVGDGTCLACDPGSRMFCMDGNFSLKRQGRDTQESAEADNEFFVSCDESDDESPEHVDSGNSQQPQVKYKTKSHFLQTETNIELH